MTRTINITRRLAEENEAGLSGAEATEVENVGSPDQAISAATEEQTALGAFKDHQLQSMSLLCDQDVTAQFLGVRYPILATTVGPPGTITFTGDLEQEIFANDLVRVEGTVGNDGIFLVDEVVEAIGVTTITLENGHAMVGAEGAVGTVARIASHKLLSYGYLVTSTTLGTGAIVITGDVSDVFEAGGYLTLQDTVANDGLWYIMSVTTDGPPVTITTIVVSDPNIAVPVGALPATEGVAGHIVRCRPAFVLVANVPFLWSIEGGLPNPFWQAIDLVMAETPIYNIFRGDVAFCMVDNATALTANFQARIGTNATIF